MAQARGGYIVEVLFGGLGRVPSERNAKVGETGITWNYTTVLNIAFLLLAAGLVWRFFRSGGGPMLKMTGGSPDGDHESHQHEHGHDSGHEHVHTCCSAPDPV
jgi:uncharacterized protein